MYYMIGPEALLASAALLLALLYPQLGSAWFRRVEHILDALARRRSASAVTCGILALLLRASLLPVLPIPKAFINDEFSFLLAGDTFAHGRLANLSHPMWQHFETFHTLFHPTYASMYPPMQGLFLAAGKLIAGHPFWGVWFSVGLMCSAICWMLQAWLPPGWAFLGGLLAVMRVGVFSYWDNSYWGGALAATGGAVVLGAFPRIVRYRRVRDTLFLALGVGVLVNTRPYEGLAVTLPVIAGLAMWMGAKQHEVRMVLIRKIAFPAALVLMLLAATTSYYFWRVTGNALQMPQQLNRQTYAIAQYFYWQRPHAGPIYHHDAMRQFYQKLEFSEYLEARSVSGFFRQTAQKILFIWAFYIGPLLTVPLVFVFRTLRDRRISFLSLVGCLGFLASTAVIFFNIHYVAPITAAMLAITLQSMRHLNNWKFEGRPCGRFLVRALVISCVLLLPLQVGRARQNSYSALGTERDCLLQQMNSLPGQQLILVRYAADHDATQEWVYNGADIDNSKVIWARDMGARQNEDLLRYYRERRVWLLQPDNNPPKLSLYSDIPTASSQHDAEQSFATENLSAERPHP